MCSRSAAYAGLLEEAPADFSEQESRRQKYIYMVSGGSRMVIKGGLNNEDLRLTLKINGDLPLCNSDL